MDFLDTIQCKIEPFADISGKDIFFSQAILDAFEKLNHSVRLGAGLHIMIGDNGTGKSTIFKQLSEKFRDDKNTVLLSLQSPQFSSLQQFLTTLAGSFKIIKPPSEVDDDKLQEAFNVFFHKQCLQEKKTVLLLIDDGHLLPDFCFQALNSLYDHHTDCRRLLQTVICGESTLEKKVKSIKELSSRVVLTVTLKPFGFKETKDLIQFHLKGAAADPNSPPALFSGAAQWAVHRLTRGSPKQIIDLCRLIVLTLEIEGRKKAGWFLTLRCATLLVPKQAKKFQLIRAGSLAGLIVLMLIFGLWSDQIKTFMTPQPAKPPVVKKIPLPPKPPSQEQTAVATEPVQPEKIEEAPSPEPPAKEIAAIPPVDEQLSSVLPPDETAPVVEETLAEKPEIAEEPVQEQVVPIAEPVSPITEPVSPVAEPIMPAPAVASVIKEKRTVKPGDTFLVMIQKVYGEGHLKPHYINQVKDANPHLKNPDSLLVGEEVFFPVLAKKTDMPVTGATTTATMESLIAKKLDRELHPVETPGIIGKLTVQRGDSLGSLIRRIYGPFSFNPDYTRKVLAVNKQLKNPDRLEVGETIYFPDLPRTPEVGLPAKPSTVTSRGDIPDFLGEIIAIEEETFGDMVRKIYGPYSFNRENTEKVLAVNPNLKSPDSLTVGQKIRFPTILVALTPKASEVWWVRLIRFDNLQSAYRFLRVYSKWSPPMLIIPSRGDAGHIHFNVLLQEYFMEEQAAQATLNGMPPSMTVDARILQGLAPSTFYYWTK